MSIFHIETIFFNLILFDNIKISIKFIIMIHGIFRSFKPSILILTLLLLMLMMPISSSSKWSTSASSSSAITTSSNSFSGYSTTTIFQAIAGAVDNSLYFSARLNSPVTIAIIKETSSNTQAWMTVISWTFVFKSLAVDVKEKYEYLSCKTKPLDLIRMDANTGDIVDAETQ